LNEQIDEIQHILAFSVWKTYVQKSWW